MCMDFHTEEAVSVPETVSWLRPMLARCWLTSVTTCEARSARFVPQEAVGLQLVAAGAVVVTVATTAARAKTDSAPAARGVRVRLRICRSRTGSGAVNAVIGGR
jgi:hypothetical protein